MFLNFFKYFIYSTPIALLLLAFHRFSIEGRRPETLSVNLSRSPGIDSQPGGIDSSFDRFPDSLNVYKIRAL
jgi:hypothetical protein